MISVMSAQGPRKERAAWMWEHKIHSLFTLLRD